MIVFPIKIGVLAVAFFASAMTGAFLTYFVRNVARSRGWTSAGAQRHHIHRLPTPRLGGVAVYFTFILLFSLAVLVGAVPAWRQSLPILAAGSLLFIVGLLDDLWSLSARAKLLFEVIAGALLFAFGNRLVDTVWAPWGWPAGVVLSLLATIAWVVIITNALNLIDGLDGLAAGSALFSVMTLFGVALIEHDASVALATLILGGAVLGFLRYNFNPATIFLGDAGSLFLGFMLSGLSLQARRAAPTMVAVAIPLVAFGLPVVETTVSVLRRFLSGKPLFSADQNHIHHRLLRMGLSHRQAVITLYAVCACCALLSLFLIYPSEAVVGLVLLVAGTIICVGVQKLGYVEFLEIGRIAHRTMEQKRVIANNVALRHAAKSLLGATSEAEITAILDGPLRGGEFDGYTLILFYQDVSGNIVDEVAIKRGSNLNDSSSVPSGKLVHLPDTTNRLACNASWTLALDLTAQAKLVGRLVIRRVYRHTSLLMDVNVLVSELQPALGAACARVALPARTERTHQLISPISIPATSSSGWPGPVPVPEPGGVLVE